MISDEPVACTRTSVLDHLHTHHTLLLVILCSDELSACTCINHFQVLALFRRVQVFTESQSLAHQFQMLALSHIKRALVLTKIRALAHPLPSVA